MYIDIDIEVYTVYTLYVYDIYISLYVCAAVSNGKPKPRRFSFIRLPFSSCKRIFFLCPFVYEETNGSFPFTNGLNGLAHLCVHSAVSFTKVPEEDHYRAVGDRKGPRQGDPVRYHRSQ